MVNSIGSYDTAVLVSSDADFVCAVNQSRSYGKQVEVEVFVSIPVNLLLNLLIAI